MDTPTYDKIVSLYTKGMIPRLISPLVGYSLTQIHRVLKSAGVTRSISQSKRRIAMDESFFEVIDTPRKAQVLGFIGADGCIRKDLMAVAIQIAAQDAPYLDFIRQSVGYGSPVRIYSSRRPNEQDMAALFLCSTKMAKDLCQLGFGPRKSLTLTFPDRVPAHLLRHFMLGYFDGDGSLSETIRRNGYADFIFTICAPEAFCRRYGDILKEAVGTNYGVVLHDSIHMLRINGNRQINKVMDWLYQDAPYLMPRKLAAYERLKQALARVDANKETHSRCISL